MQSPYRVAIWMNMPSHHQSAFFRALRDDSRIDLAVRYYGTVPETRRRQGWSGGEKLAAGEGFVAAGDSPWNTLPDGEDRIHVIPGWGSPGLRSLLRVVIRKRATWVHWSEPGRTGREGWRRWAVWPIRRFYGQLVARYALGAFAIGDLARRDFLSWGIPEDRIAFLPYVVDTPSRQVESAPEIIEFARGRKVFLYLGALSRRKGTDILIRSFAGLPKEDWVLALVGYDQGGGRYQRLVRELGIGDRVYFREVVDWDRIAPVLRAATVFILPSRFDGWGVVLNEAASMGLPLIGSDRAGSAYHLIQPGRNGFRVRAGSVESLLAAMAEYVLDPALAGEHGLVSGEIAARFTPARNVIRFLEGIDSWTH